MVPTVAKFGKLVKVELDVAVILDAVPDNVPVMVPALKLPLASLATIALAVFASVAVVALLDTLPEIGRAHV